MPCRFTFLHIFQFGVWIWSSGFALDLRSGCPQPHQPRSNHAAKDNSVAFASSLFSPRIATTKPGGYDSFHHGSASRNLTKRWLDCFVREASYAVGFFGFRPTFSCHSHFTSCPGLLETSVLIPILRGLRSFQCCGSCRRVSYFATESFFRFPCLAAPCGRSWAKSAHVYPMSNLLSVVDRVS